MTTITGIGALERQVVEAALITTRPFSSPEERSKASLSLEQWTTSSAGGSSSAAAAVPLDTSCWEAYINIIRISFATRSSVDDSSNHSNHEQAETRIIEKIAYVTSPSYNNQQQPQILSANLQHQIQREADGAKLLLLTLFCSKIRREYIRLLREHIHLARCVFEELITALLSFGSHTTGNQNHAESGSDSNSTTTLMRACCTAVAAVAVRSSTSQCLNEGLMKMILNCKTSIALSLGMHNVDNNNNSIRPFSPTVSLTLLADLPGEVQSRNDLPNADTEALLQMPFDATNMSAVDAMLDTLQLSLGGFIHGGGEMQDSLLCLTLKSLRKWAEVCKSITISRLLETASSNSNGNSILSQLVALLSSQSEQRQWSTAQHAEDAIIQSANVLSACIDNTSDFCTESRRSAVSSLLSSIQAPVEFLVAPLRNSEMQGWEDATTALSNLASTLAREEMEDISTCQLQGSFDLIQLLLELQAHPVHNVALPVLEVWLALQDVPTSDRHSSLGEPLYMQLVEVILNRIAFPSTFTSWEEELDMDSTDFDEMRRLSTDVLIGAYYLLRSAYLETLANVVMSTSSDDWEIIEAALFCLCAASREACARVKSVANAMSSGRDSPVSSDGNATALGLTQLVGTICSNPASTQHYLVLSGMCTFLGAYSTVWASSCPPQSMLEILAYLASAIISAPTKAESAGKGMRLVLIAAGPKLAKAAASPGADSSSYNFISSALTQSMEAALSTGNANVMESIAEGCARVCVQLKDSSQTRTILTAIAMPSLHRCQSSLDEIVAASSQEQTGQTSSQVDVASQNLISCLGVLKQLIRFCDATNGDTHVLTDVITAVWPILKDISTNPNCRRNEDLLSRMFDVHSQLLNAVPTLIGPHFNEIISFVVNSYEETFCPSALSYVSAAVEAFDSDKIVVAAGLDEQGKSAIFAQILSHIYQRTLAYIQTKGPSECPQVIKALFEVSQRYLLFCPGALCQCPELPSLFSLGVACLTECKGEIDSTRTALIFMYQFIGWKRIHLPEEKVRVLENFSSAIDNLLLQHGETITKSCIGGISGGAPQILWPSFSECLFAIMLHIISGSPSGEPNAILQSWLRLAMTDNSLLANSQNITAEVGTSMIQILCDLANQGVKSKPKAKMVLIDFGKIASGETTPEALVAYSVA